MVGGLLMLSKQYYKGIGVIIRNYIDTIPNGFIEDLQDFFYEDNQRFNTQRFQEFIHRRGD
jgi:hypothetical protein